MNSLMVLVCSPLAVQLHNLLFFEEALPNVLDWSEVTSRYLLFTQRYRSYLKQAQRAGWPSYPLHVGHFHLVVDPVAVAATLVEQMKQINEKLGC